MPEELARLYKVLDDWFPGAARLSQAQRWNGARPMMPDGAPVIGSSEPSWTIAEVSCGSNRYIGAVRKLTIGANGWKNAASVGGCLLAAVGKPSTGIISERAAKEVGIEDPRQERQAKALMEEAGYTTANPLKLQLRYNTNDNHQRVAVAIQSMWSSRTNRRSPAIWRRYRSSSPPSATVAP